MLEKLVNAIEARSAEGVLNLVHTLLAEGRNLQHFCREAIRHFRDLLVARVSGAESDLIAALPEQRPRLAAAAEKFSEEDLTRFFQILLATDDDLRRKPDPRLHLEMGLLRLVNAARLAPLEEVLAELNPGGSAALNARASSVQSTAHGTPGVASFPTASGKTAMGAAAGGPALGTPVAKADTFVSRAAAPNAAPAALAPASVIARSVQQFDGIEAAQ